MKRFFLIVSTAILFSCKDDPKPECWECIVDKTEELCDVAKYEVDLYLALKKQDAINKMYHTIMSDERRRQELSIIEAKYKCTKKQ